MTIDEELLAGALALMTAHAEAPQQRQAELAKTVGMHVLLMAGDLSASGEFRQVLSVLADHWNALSDSRGRAQELSPEPRLRHEPPDRLQ